MMQMSKTVFDQMVALLATNPNDLSDPTVDFIRLRLIGADFTPLPTLVKADLTLITAHLNTIGLAAIPASCYLFRDVNDPRTRLLTLITTNIGWFFYGDNTGLPFTVYGYALLGHDEDDLWAVTKFETPIVFTDNVNLIDRGNVFFTVPPSVVAP